MERLRFDYSRLRGRIIEKFGSQKFFCEAIHMSPTALTLRLSGKTYFTQGEIARANKLLEIPVGAISEYFFTERV